MMLIIDMIRRTHNTANFKKYRKHHCYNTRYISGIELTFKIILKQKKNHKMNYSTEEAVFRSCNVNYGRQLLPWSLAEDVFREIPRKKHSSAVVMSTSEDCLFRGVSWKMSFARLHGTSFFLSL